MENKAIFINQINEAVEFLRPHTHEHTKIGIITGSGLSRTSEIISRDYSVSYSDIPHFPQSTVSFHPSQWLSGVCNRVPLVIMNGRYHYYEGHSMQEITLPVRVLHKLGIKTLILTNAAGSIRPQLVPGSLAVITDHINLMGDNPLTGQHLVEMGMRFPDMSDAYSKTLINKVFSITGKMQIELQKTVFCAISGPSLPTPAETGAFQLLGADTIGMSVVPEVLTARQLGMRVLALSAITDQSYPGQINPANKKEVAGNANMLATVLKKLLEKLIQKI